MPPPVAYPHPPTRFTPPEGACDAHCHVFGPAHRFPFAPDRSYTPPDAGVEDLIALHERLGLSRAVLVQASCHGLDNSALLDALRRGGGRFAGVAMIEETTTDEALAAMHRDGVRAIRFNFVRHLGEGVDPAVVVDLSHRIAPLGWHVELHFDADQILGHSVLFEELPVQFVIDHMGRVKAADGVGQAPFRMLLDLLGSEDKAWVKVSGAERVGATGRPPYQDVVPLARAIIAAAPDRVLWGTDWPHPNVRHMPDDGDLVDLLADFAPDEASRDRILVDNPQRLYDFS